MMIGAHMSISGGVEKAIERAEEYGMTALQIFTRSSRTWSPPALRDGDADRFRAAWTASGVKAVVAHATYLVNPASPDRSLRSRSERALVDELTRCEALGIPWLILHPGSAVGTDRDAAIARAGRALARVLEATAGFSAGLLVENSAGQGDSVGTGAEEIAAILAHAGDGERLGACIDTCHAFAAGHDLPAEEGYAAFRRSFDSAIGLSRVHAMHVNDSKKPLGCRVDRHESIGRGEMGKAAFRRIVRDPVFGKLPLILETPKRSRDGEDLDAVNLALLRGL